MAEADAVGLDYAIETASVTDAVTCQLFDLWYTGMCGPRLPRPRRSLRGHWWI